MDNIELARQKIAEADSNKSKILDLSGLGLSRLTALYCAGNQLKALPSGVGKLTKFKMLNLSNNADLNIPSEVLESLDPTEILDYIFSQASG